MKSILVIDDSQANTTLLVELFQDAGYRAVAANDALSAMQHIVEVEFDLIICDYAMPGLDGQQLYDLVDAEGAYQHIPFVVMSGYSKEYLALKGNYAAFLAKPFSVQHVLSLVANLTHSGAGQSK